VFFRLSSAKVPHVLSFQQEHKDEVALCQLREVNEWEELVRR